MFLVFLWLPEQQYSWISGLLTENIRNLAMSVVCNEDK